MAYSDLSYEEQVAFHTAIINKHQQCLSCLHGKERALTPEEKKALGERIDMDMKENIVADSFATPIDINEEPTPTVEDTVAHLEGDEENART